MEIRYTVDKNGIVTSLRVIDDQEKAKNKHSSYHPKKKENYSKDIKIRSVLNNIELTRVTQNKKTKESLIIAEEGFVVLFRIYFYNSISGVIDIEFPRGEYMSDGYYDGLEAGIIRDKYKVYKLNPRNMKRDIPERYYPIIENMLLSPISSGGVKLYKSNHIFGKGVIYKFYDSLKNYYSFDLEEVKIIPPEEYLESHKQ
jgi:hypothetical protein